MRNKMLVLRNLRFCLKIDYLGQKSFRLLGQHFGIVNSWADTDLDKYLSDKWCCVHCQNCSRSGSYPIHGHMFKNCHLKHNSGILVSIPTMLLQCRPLSAPQCIQSSGRRQARVERIRQCGGTQPAPWSWWWEHWGIFSCVCLNWDTAQSRRLG